MFLVGDIGGTHARLSLLAPNGRVARHAEFDSHRFASLDAVITEFLGSAAPRPKLRAAAFGVAGPVIKGRWVATNLSWTVDAKVLGRKLGIKKVTLLNDLVALSLGAIRVRRPKLHVLGDAGYPKKGAGNVAVIAAGTGLGEAFLVWDAERTVFVPSATEGGHTDFAPREDLEVELLQFLRARFGHVSWERILSGSGLGNLYDFFVQAKGVAENAANVEALSVAPDRNALISQLGTSGKSDPATRAVELFASIYGAEAGNLALKTMALGGVYVCGNIAAHLLPKLGASFRRAFADKGRFASLMQKLPVVIVLDSDVGLAGAASVVVGAKRARS